MVEYEKFGKYLEEQNGKPFYIKFEEIKPYMRPVNIVFILNKVHGLPFQMTSIRPFQRKGLPW